MPIKSARDLNVGDILRIVITAEVIAIAPIAGTKHVKIKTEVENQGHRSYRNSRFFEGPSTLEFLDDHHVLEFLCHSSRKFSVLEDDGDDWDGRDDNDAPTPPTPSTLITAE